MPIRRCSIVKRGDTLIEVMFAFSVFSLVAILTVTMMNLGVAASERSLEVVTVRNEINAQAEALRFIHSSYIAELNLPDPTDPSLDSETRDKCANDPNFKCQQFAPLWRKITSDEAVREPANSPDESKHYTIEMPVTDCHKFYENDSEILVKNRAFILNTRKLLAQGNRDSTYNTNADAFIQALAPNPPSRPEVLFQEPPLSARVVYSTATGVDGEDDGDNSTNSLTVSQDPLQQYTRVARVEGIWIVGVKSDTTSNPQYYDFYIGSCWYGSNSSSSTSLDTVVRLYNPRK